ncbi:histidine phosphatase family protein [Gracilibacillus sp. YIM 98692]|uniref:histidine phosphatase family protein n=1 Tax=Gracilibacillus sp. YIM 98692 TaxID=2663532 RepID=UPI0013D25EFB|nr:histidine phosphatase family protein [Gracilibacillus sp. YIM 98692]
MKRILLIRHCHALAQHKDSPLSKKGNQQAYQLSHMLTSLSYSIDRILTSPHLRARESIKPFALKASIELEIDDRLKERLLSEQPMDDWMDMLEESFHDYHLRLPGGESSNDAFHRADNVLSECLADKDNENILIVTHGNLLALMLKKFNVDFGFQEWKSLTNPDVYLIERIGGEFVTERIWEDSNV